VPAQRALGIEVEIFFRRDEGLVRFHESGGDDPRTVAEPFDAGADGAGHLAVGLIIVVPVHRPPVAPVEFSVREISGRRFFGRRARSLRTAARRATIGAGLFTWVHPDGVIPLIAVSKVKRMTANLSILKKKVLET
jgi:hypothetical protein